MKKKLREYINLLLSSKGLVIVRKYDIDHRRIKLDEAIDELSIVFGKFLSPVDISSKQINLLGNLYGTNASEGLYIVSLLQRVMSKNGDVCEFGIANGATSVLIANQIRKSKKLLWLFDSFQGLSAPGAKDKLIDDIFKLGSMSRYKGAMTYARSDVEQKLVQIKFPKSRTRIVEGYVEDSFGNSNLPKRVSFAYIDFDLYGPTIDTLKFLQKKIVKGGYIIVDDYDFFSSGVKTAVNEFMQLNGSHYTMTLPEKGLGNFCILKRN